MNTLYFYDVSQDAAICFIAIFSNMRLNKYDEHSREGDSSSIEHMLHSS